VVAPLARLRYVGVEEWSSQPTQVASFFKYPSKFASDHRHGASSPHIGDIAGRPLRTP